MEKPVPSAEGKMSTSAKMSLAEIAMQLRDEQLQARVVHYKGELETSPELDAVTAQVIAELKMLQRAGAPRVQQQPETDRAQVEIDLIATLKTMLGKIFSQERVTSVVQRKLGEASKRFARLFFESELHEKIRGSDTERKTMRFAEQALYHVLARSESRLVGELDAFEYSGPEVKAEAREQLENWLRELRNAFLGRTTPELNALVRILNEVLMLFFTQELPPVVGELAWEVVKEAKLADEAMRGGYKVPAESFGRFRHAFEKRF